MTAEQFAYWCQGFVELCGNRPTEKQWAMIKEHLALVFTKVTGRGHGFVITPPFGTTEDSIPLPGQHDPFSQQYCSAIPAGDGRLCEGHVMAPDLPDHVTVNRDDQGTSGVVRQVHKDHPAARFAVQSVHQMQPNWPPESGEPAVIHTC